MPIIPPGSVYSPGDDIAESLAIIGGSIPAIVDPRRGVRERAFEIMQDPTKVEAFAKRAYAEALTLGPDGKPMIDENKRQQIVRDFAVTFGLDPDNDREFAVVGPILDSAMTALPGSVKWDLEYNLLSKNREAETKRIGAQTAAATSEARATAGQNELLMRYQGRAAELDIPTKQADVEFKRLDSADKIADVAARYVGELEKLGAEDAVLRSLLELDPTGQQAGAYLREMRLQEMSLLARYRSGQSMEGIDIGKVQNFVVERRSELNRVRDKIREVEADPEMSDEQKAVQLQALVTEYESVAAEWADLGKLYFGEHSLSLEQSVAMPQIVGRKRTGFLGIDELARDIPNGRVEWTTPLPPTVPGIPTAQMAEYHSILTGIGQPDGGIIGRDPETADARMAQQWQMPGGGKLNDLFGRMSYQEAINYIRLIELETGVQLPEFTRLVAQSKGKVIKTPAQEQAELMDRMRGLRGIN